MTNALQSCANVNDQPPPRRHLARALHTLMGSLFGAVASLSCGWPLPSLSTLSLEPSALYAALEEHTTSASRPTVPLPPLPALRPTLKKHQREAVGWMLARELAEIRTAVPGVECTWRRVRCADDRTILHWNACSGALATQPPAPTPGDVSGGVLADEMGLGKTVDVLALLLANRWTALAGEDEAQTEAHAAAQAAARPALRCPRGHALLCGAAAGPLWCDLCRGEVAQGSAVHSCATCDFDRCEACGDAAAAEGGGAEEEEDGQDEEEDGEDEGGACVCDGTPRDFDGTWVGCDSC